MKVKTKVISDHDLRGLWCALDVDESNTLLMDEFGKFLKRGAPPPNAKKPSSVKRQPTNATILEKRESMNAALASTPTKDIRAELEKAGVALPDDAQLFMLSKDFNRCAGSAWPSPLSSPLRRSPAPYSGRSRAR